MVFGNLEGLGCIRFLHSSKIQNDHTIRVNSFRNCPKNSIPHPDSGSFIVHSSCDLPSHSESEHKLANSAPRDSLLTNALERSNKIKF